MPAPLRLTVLVLLVTSPLPFSPIRAADTASAPTALEQYQYPGSTQVGEGANWKDYRTDDEFTKVVDFYRARIASKPRISTNQGAHFDTGSLTITVVRGDKGNVEVMIRRRENEAN